MTENISLKYIWLYNSTSVAIKNYEVDVYLLT